MDSDESVLRAVFNKYDTDKSGYLSPQQFIFLVSRLSKHVPELQGVEFSNAQTAFVLFDKDADQLLSFSEFKDWWSSNDKYTFFSGEKAVLLRKAYALYTEYTQGGTLNLSKFSEMMESLGITYNDSDFDILDKDKDGRISFDEFCRWLNWF